MLPGANTISRNDGEAASTTRTTASAGFASDWFSVMAELYGGGLGPGDEEV